MASLAAVQRGVEGFCERVMTKRAKREFLSSVGAFLLVVTFIEDGLRIFLRWSEQMHYMTAVMRLCALPRRSLLAARRSFPVSSTRRGSWTGMLLLLVSAAMQLGSSALVLRPQVCRRHAARPQTHARRKPPAARTRVGSSRASRHRGRRAQSSTTNVGDDCSITLNFEM